MAWIWNNHPIEKATVWMEQPTIKKFIDEFNELRQQAPGEDRSRKSDLLVRQVMRELESQSRYFKATVYVDLVLGLESTLGHQLFSICFIMDGIHSFKFSVQVWKSLTKKLIDAPLFLQNLVRNAISTWVDNVFVSPQEATVLLEQIAKFKQIEDNDRLKRLTWANEIEPLVKIKCNGPTEEQFIGCFIGSCVGDACGFTGIPNEIISSYAETDKLFEKFSHVTLENGYKFGQITNNSRFSAELLLSFIHNKGKFVPQDFAFRLSSLLLKDSPSPEKCDQATLDAVNAINNGVPWYRSGAIVGNQNCAAVRSVCIGALCWNDHQLLTRVAVDQSSCTHNTSITRAGTNKWWCE
eukprot:TRINITY_DN1911_c0_g1_i3.p1 TRINITY_DN1911_c0_g1~~TRINITY_DN1911_c0_g1_i3.p1  ORF type:complete len:353 (+),score=56.27 TRINITY_DN1911_c0_g1_i3:69-1127(+)